MALNTNALKHELNVIGLLASGGLDSSILLSHLLDLGWRVKPFYIRSGLCWQAAEKIALERYLVAVADPQLLPLTVLDLPLADVYGNHWSITGHNAPEAGTTDEAVFLPGRNALLTIKAALWCQMHGIDELAVATLRSNPFKDASASYFRQIGGRVERVAVPTVPLRAPFWRPRQAAGDGTRPDVSARLNFFLHRATRWSALWPL